MIQLELEVMLDVNKTVIKRKHDTVLINCFEEKNQCLQNQHTDIFNS